MYTDYYGLGFNPFEKKYARTGDCFRSHDFQQAMHGMNYVRLHPGIGIFTARPGMGKSFVLRCFVDGLKPGTYTIASICLTSVSVRDFYRLVCDALGLDESGSIPAMYKAIQEQAAYLYREKKQPLILIVDECHFLAEGILRDLQLLMNAEYDSVNYFSLILSGESYFNSVIRKSRNESLKQRVIAHYDYEGLSDEEVTQYVKHKIACAGATTAIMEEGAFAALLGQAEGTPRIIDNIMTDALIIGEQQGKKQIDQDVILAAVENRKF